MTKAALKSHYLVAFAIVFFLLMTTGDLPASGKNASTVSFNPIVNLSNNTGASTNPVVAVSGSYVYVAWLDTAAGGKKVFFKASSDYGVSWPLSPTILSTPKKVVGLRMVARSASVFLAFAQGGSIAFASSSNYGTTFAILSSLATGSDPALSASLPYVYVAWTGTGGVFFAASNDSGQSFAYVPPHLVGTQNGSHEVELSASGSNLYAVWAGTKTSGEGIFFAVSKNHGKLFSVAQTLNSGFVGRSREPMLSASGKHVYVTWPSNTTGLYEGYVAISNSSGTTFASPVNLTPGFLSARELQVGASGANVYVTFRGQFSSTVTNQYIVISNNNGTKWGAPFDLAQQTGNQVGFGGVAASGNNVSVMWPHNSVVGKSQMYFQASQNGGVTWGGVQQISASVNGVAGMNDPGDSGPLLAMSGTHTYVVWQDSSTGNGDIYFRGS